MSISDQDLMDRAAAVREQAYAPYSQFRVGAAVLDTAGRVHVGCNVENASYPQGACAESNAIGAMVAAGGSRIAVIAVIGGRAMAPDACTPCGGCRQRILEFADDDTVVILVDDAGGISRQTIAELLPSGFALPV